MEDLETWLAPWEKDAAGKKLEEPAELNAEQLKKYLHGLLSDKEKKAEEAEEAKTLLATKTDEYDELVRSNETDDQRRQREEKQREKEIEQLRKNNASRDALDVALSIEGITADRARALAKQLRGDDVKALEAHAKELVDEGFRVGPRVDPTVVVDDSDDDGDDLTSIPRVQRNGKPPKLAGTGKPMSVTEELDAAGIGRSGW